MSENHAPTYDPRSLPPAASGSRFALSSSPAGWSTRPDANTAAVWSQLTATAVRETAPASYARTVKLWRVGRIEGSHQFGTIERGSVTATPTRTPTVTPQRYTKNPLKAGEFLDALFLRQEGGPFFTAKDSVIFAELQRWAEAAQPDQASLNQANLAACALVLLRHGIEVGRLDEIPGWPQ